MQLTVFSLIVGAILGIGFASDKEWSYKDTIEDSRTLFSIGSHSEIYGPEDWGKAFKKCKGKAQSPINIESKKAKKTKKYGPLKLKFKGGIRGFFAGSIMNDGRAPTFTLDQKQGNVTVKFDKKTYHLHKFHFHFGCNGQKGSEHTIDEKAYPAEMQLVFHNKKYKYEKATKKKNGLLVIAALIKKAKEPYYYWLKTEGLDGLLMPAITAIASGYIGIGNPIVNLELPLKKLIPRLGSKLKEEGPSAYYTYKGSLTTPGCYESARWVILKKPIKISRHMLRLYRNLKTRVGYYRFANLCDNYRPTQKLNDRKVELFKPKKKKKKKGKKGLNKKEDETPKMKDKKSAKVKENGPKRGSKKVLKMMKNKV